MNSIGAILLSLIILAVAALIVILIVRVNRSRTRILQALQDKVSEFPGGPRNKLPADATVLGKSQIISPDAQDIAKVDLQLEISLSGKAPYQVSTCWLVEVESLDQLSVGKIVSVGIDPRQPDRVFPKVPWARLWVFGK
jgi:hypothetical protein